MRRKSTAVSRTLALGSFSLKNLKSTSGLNLGKHNCFQMRLRTLIPFLDLRFFPETASWSSACLHSASSGIVLTLCQVKPQGLCPSPSGPGIATDEKQCQKFLCPDSRLSTYRSSRSCPPKIRNQEHTGSMYRALM